MTQQEKKDLAKQIAQTAFWYGLEMSAERLSLILNHWMATNISPHLLIDAYKRFTEVSKFNRFPTPAEIYGMIDPELSVEDEANLIATKIRQAISRCGYADPEGARKFIGDVGWNIVIRFGGWLYICENHGELLNPSTFHAQCRDVAKAQINSFSARPKYTEIESGPRSLEIENSKSEKDLLKLINIKELK